MMMVAITLKPKASGHNGADDGCDDDYDKGRCCRVYSCSNDK